MSGVSEAEVKAVATALCNARRSRYDIPTISTLDVLIPEARADYIADAREAITAVARVKAQDVASAENRIATPVQEAEFASYVESVARALHEAHMPYCDYTYPFDDPMSSSDMYRELARAVTLVRAGGGVQ